MSECQHCHGRGHFCIDDLCQGGECIHGDVCDFCDGDGGVDDEDDYDYYPYADEADE